MARRNNAPVWAVIGALIVLGIILFAATGNFKLPAGFIGEPSGYTPFAISKVTLNGQNQMLVSASFNKGAHKAVINLNDAPEIKSALIAAGRIPKNVTIYGETNLQTCGYNIDYQNEIIYSPNVQTNQHMDGCYVNGVSICQSMGYQLHSCSNYNPITSAYTYTSTDYCYTYGDSPIYQKGYVSGTNPAINWNVKLTIDYGDGSAPSIINTNPNTANVVLPYSIGNADWIGNLGGYAECGVPQNIILTRGLNELPWKTAPISTFNSYMNAKNSYDSQKTSITGGWAAATTLTNAVNTISASRSNESYTNQYVYTPSTDVVFPAYTFTLNLDKISFEAPKYAQAKLLDLSTQGIEETNVVNVFAKIQNIGTQQDSFDVVIQDCSPASLTLYPVRIPIATGDIQTAQLKVEGVAGTYTCKIKATPINNPVNGTDMQSFQITIAKRTCPADFACCQDLTNYRDRGCVDTSKIVTNAFTVKDPATNDITAVTYESCVQIQHYSCAGYACSASTTETLAGSCSTTTVPIGTNPTPSGSPTPVASPLATYIPPEPTQQPAPTPTTIVFATPTPTPGIGTPTPIAGIGAFTIAGINGWYIFGAIIILILGLFILLKTR